MVKLWALNLLPLKVSCPSIQPEHSLSLTPHAIQDLLSGLAITENRFTIGIQCSPFITHTYLDKIHHVVASTFFYHRNSQRYYSRLSLTQLCITQYYHLTRPDGQVPVFSPIYNCIFTTFISTTAKSTKLITRYEKLVPLIDFSVFYNA